MRILLITFLYILTIIPCYAAECKLTGIVNASKKEIWEAIMKEKTVDKSVVSFKEKVVQDNPRIVELKEEVYIAPLIPNDKITFFIIEKRYDKINYAVISSTYFDSMFGTWEVYDNSFSLTCSVHTKLKLPECLVQKILDDEMHKRTMNILKLIMEKKK